MVIKIGAVHDRHHIMREAHCLDEIKILLDCRLRLHYNRIVHSGKQVLPLRMHYPEA